MSSVNNNGPIIDIPEYWEAELTSDDDEIKPVCINIKELNINFGNNKSIKFSAPVKGFINREAESRCKKLAFAYERFCNDLESTELVSRKNEIISGFTLKLRDFRRQPSTQGISVEGIDLMKLQKVVANSIPDENQIPPLKLPKKGF